MNQSTPRRRLATGGAVNPRKHVYITRRDVEEQVLSILRSSEYCNILSSRQVGKTSLIFRIRETLKGESIRVVVLDITSIGSQETAERWFRDLLMQCSSQLRLPIDFLEWWQEHEHLSLAQRFSTFFSDVAISADTNSPIVVFLDEIDSTLKLPYTDDLFTTIRYMYNQRPSEPRFEQVSFCLIGVATPDELVKDRRTTSYNIGQSVELRDFNPEVDDLSELTEILSEVSDDASGLLEDILRWTNGHPYLTAMLCSDALEAGAGQQSVDLMVSERFSALEELRTDVHFQQILRFLDYRLARPEATLELYRELLLGRPVRDGSSNAHVELRLAGLVRSMPDGTIAIRNQIYRQVFDKKWLSRQRPDRARRRWRLVAVASTAGLLAILGWLIVHLAVTGPARREQAIIHSIQTAEWPDLISLVRTDATFPIPSSKQTVRENLEVRLKSEVELALSSHTTVADLKATLSALRESLVGDEMLLTKFDSLIVSQAFPLVAGHGWRDNLDTTAALLSIKPDDGVLARLEIQLRQYMDEMLQRSTFPSNTEWQEESTQLLSAVASSFPPLDKLATEYQEQVAGLTSKFVMLSLDDVAKEQSIGPSLTVTGSFVVPAGPEAELTLFLTDNNHRAERDSAEKRARWVVYSIQSLWDARYTRKLIVSISVADSTGRRLLSAKELLVDASVGQELTFRVSRENALHAISIGSDRLEHQELFHDPMRTRALGVSGDATWRVSNDKVRFLRLPDNGVSAIQLADQAFLDGEFRLAATRYHDIERQTTSTDMKAECLLKKAMCARELRVVSRDIWPLVSYPDLGSVEKNLQRIFSNLTEDVNHRFAGYAAYIRLVDILKRSGLKWTAAQQLEVAHGFDYLNLVPQEERSRVAPPQLWEAVQLAVRGKSATLQEQLRISSDDVAAYQAVMEYFELVSSAPEKTHSLLLAGTAEAYFYNGQTGDAYQRLSTLVDSPYVRCRGDIYNALYGFTWAATLLGRDREGIEKVEEVRTYIPWKVGFERMLDVLEARAELCTDSPVLTTQSRLAKIIEQRELTHGTDDDNPFYASAVCDAYLLLGLLTRNDMRQSEEIENGEDVARTIWAEGYDFGVKKDVSPATITMVALASLSGKVEVDFVERSFEQNIRAAGGAFSAARLLLPLLRTHMSEISLAVGDMYAIEPGKSEVDKLILRTVPPSEFRILQAELGMLNTIRRGAFPHACSDEQIALIRRLSRAGIAAWQRRELEWANMMQIVLAWLTPQTANIQQIHPSVQHELAYVFAHRLLLQTSSDAQDKAAELLEFAKDNAPNELTRALASESLEAIDSSATAVTEK